MDHREDSHYHVEKIWIISDITKPFLTSIHACLNLAKTYLKSLKSLVKKCVTV